MKRPRRRRGWEFSVRCGYIDRESGANLYKRYNKILGKLAKMINNPND